MNKDVVTEPLAVPSESSFRAETLLGRRKDGRNYRVAPHSNGTSVDSSGGGGVTPQSQPPPSSASANTSSTPPSSSGLSFLVLGVVFVASLVLIFWAYTTFPQLEE